MVGALDKGAGCRGRDAWRDLILQLFRLDIMWINGVSASARHISKRSTNPEKPFLEAGCVVDERGCVLLEAVNVAKAMQRMKTLPPSSLLVLCRAATCPKSVQA